MKSVVKQSICIIVGIVLAQGWLPNISQIVIIYEAGEGIRSTSLVVLLVPFFVACAATLALCLLFGSCIGDPRKVACVGVLCVLFSCSLCLLNDSTLPGWKSSHLTVMTSSLLGIGSALFLISWAKTFEVLGVARGIAIAAVVGASLLVGVPQALDLSLESVAVVLAVTAVGAPVSVLCQHLALKEVPFAQGGVREAASFFVLPKGCLLPLSQSTGLSSAA